MTVRVGVVGTGFGARVVAPVFDATPGCSVVDVVSARDDAGVAALCDRSDVDLISVHSPPFLHVSHVRRAIRSEHAVLCDKPFGMSADDAQTLLAAAEAADVQHFLNFEFRYDPMRELVRGLLDDGLVGTPEHVSWTHYSSGSRVPLRHHGWLFDRASGGGWVGAWGSHAVDALIWMLGDIDDARAECRTTITERPDANGKDRPCDAEDGFTASLRFASGADAAIDTSFAASASIAPRLTINGSTGVLECVADAKLTVRHADGEREEHDRPAPEGDPHLEPMRRWALVVRDAVDEGETPKGAPTFADGLACARVLDRLRADRD